ncbi:MAG: helix-turn-helix domain-containing protein [Flavobacteriaceae bacterium]|jgi:YesN/AraC family two-component response regulator|nr:helix-turn-helix domain-containing protein [Flavobacteriaceae bacterium]
MKTLLFLFLTLITGGNQFVSWQKTSIPFLSEGSRYVQWIEDCFFQGSNQDHLGMVENYLSIYEDEIVLTEESFIESEGRQYSLRKMGVIFLVLFVSFLGLFIQRYRSKNVLRSISKSFSTTEQEETNYSEVVEDFLDIENEKRYITLEKEVSILHQIEAFEQDKSFLDKNISLNVLAAKFGINHRYLSYVVNKHKECDFATYVNELRVMYIVHCLRSNPQYLKYKISYLADQCGFASHSRFTVTFKKVTGYPPSVFISNLKKEKNKYI